MSTNAVIAVPHGDGWRGRSTHWDGDPACVGQHVYAIVQREGIERARQVLTEDYYGWSTIGSDQPDLTGVRKPRGKYSHEVAKKYGRKSPEYAKYNFNNSGQFVNVPGFGVAYSSCELPKIKPGYRQSQETNWFDQNDTGSWIEWAYVIADDGLWVLKGHHEEPFELIEVVRWDSEPDELYFVALYNRWAFPDGIDYRGNVVCDAKGVPVPSAA